MSLNDRQYARLLELQLRLQEGFGIEREVADRDIRAFMGPRHTDRLPRLRMPERVVYTPSSVETYDQPGETFSLMERAVTFVRGPTVAQRIFNMPVGPAMQINMGAYRTTVREFRDLFVKHDPAQARKFFPGFRPYEELKAASHVPLFGHDRFRKFSREPYFPDTCGFLQFHTGL